MGDREDMEAKAAAEMGYNVVGTKQLRLREWRMKKELEDPEFEKLCSRLYQRNHARKSRAKDPERARRRQREWRARNREWVRARERAKRAEKKKPPKPRPCVICKELFTPKRFNYAKFCSQRCRNKHHTPANNKRKEKLRRAAGKPKRDRSFGKKLLATLKEHPWSMLREIEALMPDFGRPTIATRLCALLKEGKLIDDGKKKYKRYALAGETTPPGPPRPVTCKRRRK